MRPYGFNNYKGIGLRRNSLREYIGDGFIRIYIKRKIFSSWRKKICSCCISYKINTKSKSLKAKERRNNGLKCEDVSDS